MTLSSTRAGAPKTNPEAGRAAERAGLHVDITFGGDDTRL